MPLKSKFKYFVLAAALVFSAGFSIFASAQPHRYLWKFWLAYTPNSALHLNHSAWQHFLNKYVHKDNDGINQIDYSHVSRIDKLHLHDYLWNMSQVHVEQLNRKEQLAYWLNLYNALTVKTILDHYPVHCIRKIDISPGIFADGPWDAILVRISNKDLTLNDIEHRILRPIWQDPRIHYALNYGAVGSPNLFIIAFTGKNVDKQLNQAASGFINSLRGVQVIDGQLVTSKLFYWYKDDFGGDTHALIDHITYYASPQLKAQLKPIHNIATYIFNWHLNDAPPLA